MEQRFLIFDSVPTFSFLGEGFMKRESRFRYVSAADSPVSRVLSAGSVPPPN